MAYKDSLKETDTSAAASTDTTEDALSILDAAIEADSAELLIGDVIGTSGTVECDEAGESNTDVLPVAEQALSNQLSTSKRSLGWSVIGIV